MKKVGIIIGVLAVASLILLVFVKPDSSSKNNKSNTTKSQSSVEKRQFTDIKTAVSSKKAQLLDVRTPAEYAEGHFELATNVDSVDIAAGKIPQLDKSLPTYVYCRSGNRSAEASKNLKAAGFSNVIDLGGLADVQAIGGKLIK